MLDIAQVDPSQDSRIVKLQKEEFKNCKAWPIERQIWLIETRFLQIINQAWKPMKRLGFESNTARYKKENLNSSFKSLMNFYELLLWDLWGSVTF